LWIDEIKINSFLSHIYSVIGRYFGLSKKALITIDKIIPLKDFRASFLIFGSSTGTMNTHAPSVTYTFLESEIALSVVEQSCR
jgi:hypothetical protein